MVLLHHEFLGVGAFGGGEGDEVEACGEGGEVDLEAGVGVGETEYLSAACIGKGEGAVARGDRGKEGHGDLVFRGIGGERNRAGTFHTFYAHCFGAECDGVAPRSVGFTPAPTEASDAKLVALVIGQGDGGRSVGSLQGGGIVPVASLGDIGHLIAHLSIASVPVEDGCVPHDAVTPQRIHSRAWLYSLIQRGIVEKGHNGSLLIVPYKYAVKHLRFGPCFSSEHPSITVNKHIFTFYICPTITNRGSFGYLFGDFIDFA